MTLYLNQAHFFQDLKEYWQVILGCLFSPDPLVKTLLFLRLQLFTWEFFQEQIVSFS